MVWVIYLQNGEPSKKISESSLIIFTKSRLNIKPEKLHSEGKANKLYASPASDEVHDKPKWDGVKTTFMPQPTFKFTYHHMFYRSNIKKRSCFSAYIIFIHKLPSHQAAQLKLDFNLLFSFKFYNLICHEADKQFYF